jgi:aspartate/methionine/tyrosine aminotransferase
MQLRPFRIEQYFARYEFTAQYMLSSSDAESRSVAELLEFEPQARSELEALWLGYTEVPGASSLREAVAQLYQQISLDEVRVLSSAEECIFVAYHALIGSADHVIVESPHYESAQELARSTGAQVSVWERHFEEGWAHDLAALERLIRPNTRMIYIASPSNPLGLLMRSDIQQAVAELARGRNIILLCDEVYRELEHDPATRLRAACDLYENAISIGSMSKSYGLAGLRLGWLASRNQRLLERCNDLRMYTSICSSAPSEFLAALALRNRDHLLRRNLGIVHQNLPLLYQFLDRHDSLFDLVKPDASTICLPRLNIRGDVTGFCERLVAATSVMLLPGSVYDLPRFIRIGYGRANMPAALQRLEQYLLETAAQENS